MVRFGDEPRKLYRKTKLAFKDKYDKKTIKKWLTKFYWRFFSQQFKRSCIPDGPKVGSVSLSPRGDWRMPSDANVSNWIDEIEKYNKKGFVFKINTKPFLLIHLIWHHWSLWCFRLNFCNTSFSCNK